MSETRSNRDYLTAHWLEVYVHVKNKNPDEVLAAFVEPEVVEKWFVEECRFAGRAGGELYWKWWDGMEETALVREYEPGKKLVCEWNAGEGIRTTFTMTLEWLPDKNATRLTLREGPFPCTEAGMKAFSDIATGWGHEFLALRMFLEHGIDTRHRWNEGTGGM